MGIALDIASHGPLHMCCLQTAQVSQPILDLTETDRAIHRPPLNLPKESVLSVASLCSPHWLCNQMHPSGHPAVIKVSTFSNLHFSQKLFLYSYCNREQCGLGRLGVSPGEEWAKSGAKYAMAEVADAVCHNLRNLEWQKIIGTKKMETYSVWVAPCI